jgi:hypothetical protein
VRRWTRWLQVGDVEARAAAVVALSVVVTWGIAVHLLLTGHPRGLAPSLAWMGLAATWVTDLLLLAEPGRAQVLAVRWIAGGTTALALLGSALHARADGWTAATSPAVLAVPALLAAIATVRHPALTRPPPRYGAARATGGQTTEPLPFWLRPGSPEG